MKNFDASNGKVYSIISFGLVLIVIFWSLLSDHSFASFFMIGDWIFLMVPAIIFSIIAIKKGSRFGWVTLLLSISPMLVGIFVYLFFSF